MPFSRKNGISSCVRYMAPLATFNPENVWAAHVGAALLPHLRATVEAGGGVVYPD